VYKRQTLTLTLHMLYLGRPTLCLSTSKLASIDLTSSAIAEGGL